MDGDTFDDEILTEDALDSGQSDRRRRRRRRRRKGRHGYLSKLTPFELKIMYGVMCLILAASSFLPAFIFLGVGSAMSPVHVDGINVFLVVGGIFLGIGVLSGLVGILLCRRARMDSRRPGGCKCQENNSICRCKASYEPIATV